MESSQIIKQQQQRRGRPRKYPHPPALLDAQQISRGSNTTRSPEDVGGGQVHGSPPAMSPDASQPKSGQEAQFDDGEVGRDGVGPSRRDSRQHLDASRSMSPQSAGANDKGVRIIDTVQSDTMNASLAMLTKSSNQLGGVPILTATSFSLGSRGEKNKYPKEHRLPSGRPNAGIRGRKMSQDGQAAASSSSSAYVHQSGSQQDSVGQDPAPDHQVSRPRQPPEGLAHDENVAGDAISASSPGLDKKKARSEDCGQNLLMKNGPQLHRTNVFPGRPPLSGHGDPSGTGSGSGDPADRGYVISSQQFMRQHGGSHDQSPYNSGLRHHPYYASSQMFPPPPPPPPPPRHMTMRQPAMTGAPHDDADYSRSMAPHQQSHVRSSAYATHLPDYYTPLYPLDTIPGSNAEVMRLRGMLDVITTSERSLRFRERVLLEENADLRLQISQAHAALRGMHDQRRSYDGGPMVLPPPTYGGGFGPPYAGGGGGAFAGMPTLPPPATHDRGGVPPVYRNPPQSSVPYDHSGTPPSPFG